MSQFRDAKKIVQNSRGMLSADFLFSLILCSALCSVLFAFNFTLSMVEVAQYVAFSVSRAYAAGHVDESKQEQMAQAKFAELMAIPALKDLFASTDGKGWFKLANLDIRGGGQSGRTFSDYPESPDRVPQIGIRLDFTANVLHLRVPLLGSTTDENTSNGFTAKITGLLFREPTSQECMQLQISQRYSQIMNLDPRYQVLGAKGAGKYVAMEDNGC